jgi:hypothetical protein
MMPNAQPPRLIAHGPLCSLGAALLLCLALAAASASAKPATEQGRLLSSLTAPKQQYFLSQGRLVGFIVYPTCQSACSLKGVGALKVKGRSYALQGAKKGPVLGFQSLTLTVNASAKAKKQLKADLSQKGVRGTATAEVRATDESGYSEKAKVSTAVIG